MIAPLTLLGLAGLSAAAATVETSKGTVTGGSCTGVNTEYFFSIPYATPPTGDLWFVAPEPFNGSYASTLTTQAPACEQFGTAFIETGATSEDCLYINVWRPATADSTSELSVKVWFYGGSDAAGGISDAMYDGCELATDAMVVSANYRLGPLGWLCLLSANLTGNYGLQDQLLALQWVQDNIAAFGGDPTKVVVFGQSAGAINVFAVSDAACLRSKTPTEFNNTYLEILSSVNVPSAGTLAHNGRGNAWGPLVDGIIVKQQPSEVGVKVPSIFGSATQDGALFVLAQYQTPELNQSNWDEFLTANFGALAGTINETVGVSHFASTPFPVFYAMTYAITDMEYRCTSYRGAVAAAENNVPVWTYSFNPTPSCHWLTSLPQENSILELLGPTHTAELPFVWGLLTNQPAGTGNCSFNEAERNMSAWMINAWTSMAQNGHPGADWPAFNASSSMGINFNDGPEASIVDYTICAEFWDSMAGEIRSAGANMTVTTPANSNLTSLDSPASVVSAATASAVPAASVVLMFVALAAAI